MLKKFLLTAFLVIAALTIIPPANAEFDGDTMNVRIKENSFSLFPRHFYMIEIFNNPRISESRFTLRLSSYGEVSGCATMTAPYIDKKVVSNKIRISVRDPELYVNRWSPRYSNTDCDVNMNRSFFDIELDRDVLMARGIKHIDLQSQRYGEFFTSDIEVTKEKIDLTAKTVDGQSLITYWFMPQDTVILHTPNSKRELDVKDHIREFGIAQGLIPLEETFRDFELPWNAYNFVYFTNPAGDMVNKVNSYMDYVPVGKITPTRTVQTATGPVQETYDLTVYASIPGPEEEGTGDTEENN